METVFLNHFYAIGAVVLLLHVALLLLLFSKYYTVRKLKGGEQATPHKRMVLFFSLLFLLFLFNYFLILKNPHFIGRDGFKDIVFAKCCFLLLSTIFLYFTKNNNSTWVRVLLNGAILFTAILLIFDDIVYFLLPEPFLGTLFKYYINVILYLFVIYRLVVGCKRNDSVTKLTKSFEIGFSSIFIGMVTLLFVNMVIKGDGSAMFLLFIILLVSLGLSMIYYPINRVSVDLYKTNMGSEVIEMSDSPSKSKEGYDIVKQRLLDYFENEKPYLSPDLSIGEVAVRIFTNKSYLSKTINIKMDKNFREFVNYYRIREAMRLYLADESLSLVELCSLSGFRNNASFTNAFKINTGCTPAEWCRAIKIRRRNGENFEIALSY